MSNLTFNLLFIRLGCWCLMLLRNSDLKRFPVLDASSRCHEAISTKYVARGDAKLNQ